MFFLFCIKTTEQTKNLSAPNGMTFAAPSKEFIKALKSKPQQALIFFTKNQDLRLGNFLNLS